MMEPLQRTATVDDASFEAPIRLLAPGTAIAERYEVRGVLGVGGYAVVYRAWDRELGREIALKILRQERLSEQTLARFRREVALARETSSPHVVRVFDIGSSGSTFFLTMELVLGESLKERLRRGPLPVSDAVHVGLEVLSGLEALHRLGIVHRDLKPGNILLPHDGGAKLADFGLARRFDRDEAQLTGTTALLGTIDYLSPEQALGKEVDQRTDLYAFGVVLFEMLTGGPPFVGSSSLETLLSHLKRRAPDLARAQPGAPRWLAAVVARLLEKEPGKRYPDAASVVNDLRRGRGPRLRQLLRRRAVWAATLSAVLLVGSGATWWQFHTRPEFSHLVPDGRAGIAAIGRKGETLWRKPGVDLALAHRFVLARLKKGERPLLAGVLRGRNQPDPGQGRTRTLDLLEPESGEVVRRLNLPRMAYAFPDFPDRYRADQISAVDLDEDGVDELIVTYIQLPEWPSYTVLYEPRLDRPRELFAVSGHHYYVGAEDLDGDGKRELLFAGINNLLGWVYALAALRVEPWIGDTKDSEDEAPISSPGLATFPEDRRLLWYALLPRGPLLDFTRCLTVDRARRVLNLAYADGRTLTLGFDGFPLSALGVERLHRNDDRRTAYSHLREAQRLLVANFAAEALRELEAGAESSMRAGDPLLNEVFERFRAKSLVVAGRLDEAEVLFTALADVSPAASEIAFDAGEAFHLRGDLDRAAAWYERGIKRGGTTIGSKSRHRYVEGMVFAMAEGKQWSKAHSFVDKYQAAYPGEKDRTRTYSEYIRWRAGTASLADGTVAPPYADDSWRYVALELRRERHEDAARLLREVETALTMAYETRGALMSLKAEVLSQLGRQVEALTTARKAVELLRAESLRYPVARAHLGMAQERLSVLESARKKPPLVGL